MLRVEQVQQAWQQWLNKLPPKRQQEEEVKAVRWMIEELRVSLFAQQLGTPYPISDKRILQTIEQLAKLRCAGRQAAGAPQAQQAAQQQRGGQILPARRDRQPRADQQIVQQPE